MHQLFIQSVLSALYGEEEFKGQNDDEDNLTHSHVLTKGVAKENHYGNGHMYYCTNALHFELEFN